MAALGGAGTHRRSRGRGAVQLAGAAHLPSSPLTVELSRTVPLSEALWILRLFHTTAHTPRGGSPGEQKLRSQEVKSPHWKGQGPGGTGDRGGGGGDGLRTVPGMELFPSQKPRPGLPTGRGLDHGTRERRLPRTAGPNLWGGMQPSMTGSQSTRGTCPHPQFPPTPGRPGLG